MRGVETSSVPPPPGGGIHLMAKPVGPICNLDCDYCFYLEKERFYPEKNRFLMTDEVLEAYIRQNIESEQSAEVLFTWQGGEPMLHGMDFFRTAVRLQQEYANGKTIRNALQTNGVLLDAAWCEFLKAQDFMVGISLDGPKDIHDAYRVDKQGRGTFNSVMQGIALLQNFQIPFNALVTVSDVVARQPVVVYQFLKQLGVSHIQFNPVVERMPEIREQSIGLHFAQPGKQVLSQPILKMTPHSVTPEAYGAFLIQVFDLWVREDVGEVFVLNFEWALASALGLQANVCLFSEQCGRALILEHDGDVYSCDHFMYPEHKLGNLVQTGLLEMANSAQQLSFGSAKSDSLPAYCKECPYLRACYGECPKNRFAWSPDGEHGLNYLCAGYRAYFSHIDRYIAAMAKLIAHGKPASLVMQAVKGPLLVPL